MLMALAEECPDYGMTILRHLFGFSSKEFTLGKEGRQGKTDTAFSICLLTKLCEPTSNLKKQRCVSVCCAIWLAGFCVAPIMLVWLGPSPCTALVW